MLWFLLAVGAIVAILVVLAVIDLLQTKHAIRRNFPIIGRLRYGLEAIGPEIRQYFVTDNDEERPFSRDQRRWVYASSKMENPYFGFGTDNNLEAPSSGYVIIKHEAFPHPATEADADPLHPVPASVVLGELHGRRKAFQPPSIVNVSAMSYGSLSGAAVESINRGVATAGAMQNTGEGGISKHHRHGGDLMFQFGTGYFGVRNEKGEFDLGRATELVQTAPVRCIEIKLSQGAKPGLGGMLPGAKVTPEIAEIRAIAVGQDCASPSYHTAFTGVGAMCEFIESIAESTGLPVGIKSAVGAMGFFEDLAAHMAHSGTGPDFITIDGGEGGTGAAPLTFSDHVALPFLVGFPRVYKTFAEHDLHDRVPFIGSGKLGLPESGLLALALGCDLIHVAREPMMAIGCIQAQKCHSGHCPTGVATQKKWLVRGLDPDSKADRLANYLVALRMELLKLAHACGQPHPSLVDLDHFEMLVDRFESRPAAETVGYEAGWGLPTTEQQVAITQRS